MPITANRIAKLRPSVRFEVLKRDRFCCRYCGKSAPEVLLEVDHVIPVSAGGTNALDNLVSACATCNRGKGSRLLEEGSGVPTEQSVDEMHARVKQLRQYRKWLKLQDEDIEKLMDLVYDAWYSAFGFGQVSDKGVRTCAWGWPEQASIRGFLKLMPVTEIIEAVWITMRKARATKVMHKNDSALRYFYAVCHGKIRDLRGSV